MSVFPSDVRQLDQRTLAIDWSDGKQCAYDVRDLRLACPCALCVDELTGAKILDPATVTPDVRPVSIVSIGNYALKFAWSDGHDTGLYTYERLHGLCGD